METLSIIVPCYNEQDSIPIFYQELIKQYQVFREKIDLEIIFVDDGSKDKTLDEIKKLSTQDKTIKYVSFSRNFGKESAMYAGLEKSSGDFVAMMDADLQDPPELLIDMYNSIVEEGYDCVATRRTTRKGEPPLRSLFSKTFYLLINKISKTEVVDGARDYRMMTRSMVDAILGMKEYNRFSKGLFSWVGFKTKWLKYENIERVAGETKWSFWKLLKYAFEGIIDFSTAPLAIASALGILFCLISFIFMCVIIFKTIIFGDPVAGYPSMMCAIFFMGGIQLFCIGIMGQYISRTYLETKHRPIYIVKDSNIN